MLGELEGESEAPRDVDHDGLAYGVVVRLILKESVASTS